MSFFKPNTLLTWAVFSVLASPPSTLIEAGAARSIASTPNSESYCNWELDEHDECSPLQVKDTTLIELTNKDRPEITTVGQIDVEIKIEAIKEEKKEEEVKVTEEKAEKKDETPEVLVATEQVEVQKEDEVKKEGPVEVKVTEEKAEKKDETPEVLVATEQVAATQKKEESTVAKTEAEHACELSDKNNALTKQVEELSRNQSQIMMAMMQQNQMMNQMMMAMMQQNQMQTMNIYSQFSHGPAHQQPSPYQYQAQTTAGSWVYHPQGFQPGQAPLQNFFPDQMRQPQFQMAGPFMPQNPPIGVDGMHNWGLRPDYQFNFGPQMGPSSVPMGQFGMNQLAQPNGIAFNFGSSV